MTQAENIGRGRGADGLASTSGDLGLELLGLRVNGAQLGAMLGVSRQAVSSAARRGAISSAGPDGLFDARRAVREWMANTEPARMRARLLRPGAEMVTEMRERLRAMAEKVETLRAELDAERALAGEREKAAAWRAEGDAAKRLQRFADALGRRFEEACAARACGRWESWLDELVAVEYYEQDLADYRADFPDDPAEGDGEQSADLSRVEAGPGTNPGQ